MSAAAGVVEYLFRHGAGRITATLARARGPARLELAEEAVADALVQALQVWPHEGVPANPQGWLFRTARNRAVDLLRREDTLRVKLPALAQLDVATATQAGDDELALILLCCHPELPLASVAGHPGGAVAAGGQARQDRRVLPARAVPAGRRTAAPVPAAPTRRVHLLSVVLLSPGGMNTGCGCRGGRLLSGVERMVDP